jgi:hypothetical protein
VTTEEKPGVQLEGEGADTIEVVYGGETFAFPAEMDDVDGDVLDALDDRKISHALKALLGDDQWLRFKKSKPKVSDYNGLFEKYAEAVGLESVGE